MSPTCPITSDAVMKAFTITHDSYVVKDKERSAIQCSTKLGGTH